ACVGPFGSGARAAERVLHLRIARRRIENAPATIRVTAGDGVELRWTTDEVTSVHVHGYNIQLTLDPATEGRMRFVANAAGRFPISAHGFGAVADQGAHREVVLLYLEAHPD
ncbi:MAG: hypothetical protein M3023_04630, partial [Pseudomonadota bacterium]|nr:hypothetical protein [Pseudomonadota bacterium]